MVEAVFAAAAIAAGGRVDLRRVNWESASLPGRVCGVRHPIRLRRGKAFVASPRWPRLRRIEVAAGWAPVVYGDLDQDGHDEAALGVECSNGGGTAAGALAYAQVIFRPGRTRPIVVGVITPRHQGKGELPTLLTVRFGDRRLVAREAFYGPHDGTCCPSGRALTTWAYRKGTLRFVESRITRRASGH